jgi:hypothetical protein
MATAAIQCRVAGADAVLDPPQEILQLLRPLKNKSHTEKLNPLSFLFFGFVLGE